MNKPEELLVEVHPGTGLVSRHEDSLLVIPSLGPDQWPRARQLVAICQRELDPTRRIRARAVAALLTEAEPDEVPGFALMLGLADAVTVTNEPDPLTAQPFGLVAVAMMLLL